MIAIFFEHVHLQTFRLKHRDRMCGPQLDATEAPPVRPTKSHDIQLDLFLSDVLVYVQRQSVLTLARQHCTPPHMGRGWRLLKSSSVVDTLFDKVNWYR
jgi:hypothetical protein